MTDWNQNEVDMEELVCFYLGLACRADGVSYGATSSISKNTL